MVGPARIFKCTQVGREMCNFSSGNLRKVRLGPLMRRWLQWGSERCGKDGLGGQAPQLEQDGGPSAADRADLGSCRLGNCTLGKLPLRKKPLGGTLPLGKNLSVMYLTSFFQSHPLWVTMFNKFRYF